MSDLDRQIEKGEKREEKFQWSAVLINLFIMICTLTDGAAPVTALVAPAERRRYLRGEPPPLMPVGRRRRGIQRVMALRRHGGRERGRRTPRHRRVAHHCVGISKRCIKMFVHTRIANFYVP